MKKKRTKPPGSGRKKGPPSKVIRVPHDKIKAVEDLIYPSRKQKTK